MTPSTKRLALATILSLVGSLGVCALLVWAATSLYPSFKSYGHFHFWDYGTLTILGVLLACGAWPAVTRITSNPRRLFSRVAVAVTFVLWLPDLYLFLRHEPARAIITLMVMHLGIALVTYQLLVRVAPPRDQGDAWAMTMAHLGEADVTLTPVIEAPRGSRWRRAKILSSVLAVTMGVEFALGTVALFKVPTSRPSGWLPRTGETLYLLHGVVGFPLALGAVVLLVATRRSTRVQRFGAWSGAVGVAVAGVGGLLTESHPLRLAGMAIMLLGALLGGLGYLMPAVEPSSHDSLEEPLSTPTAQ
ncbi:MAG: hypothetical protein ACRDVC_07715 [Acidimicrobiales bacterium]